MMGLSDEGVADLLTYIVISCKKTDVENAKRLPFTPNACPPTEAVRYLLRNLTLHLPSIEENCFSTMAVHPILYRWPLALSALFLRESNDPFQFIFHLTWRQLISFCQGAR